MAVVDRLDEEVFKTQRLGVIDDGLVFPPRDPPAKKRVTPHGRNRRILGHDAQGDLVRKMKADQIECGDAVFNEARQDEMADQEAARGDIAVKVKALPDLAGHLLQGGDGHCDIIADARQLTGRLIRTELEIGQVYLHIACEKLNYFRVFIAAAIIDEGNRQPLPAGQTQALDDERRLGRRRDGVDVVTSFFLETEHHAGKTFGRHALSPCTVTDRIVLAEDATQIAGRKKDRPRPITTRQGRLLAEMGQGAIHDQTAGEPAETCFSRRPVHPAPPGTQDASVQHVQHQQLLLRDA